MSFLYYESDNIAVDLVIMSFLTKEVTFDPPETNVGTVMKFKYGCLNSKSQCWSGALQRQPGSFYKKTHLPIVMYLCMQ